MKLLCLVALLVCAFAQASEVEYEEVRRGTSVENHLENSVYELDLLAAEHEVTEADQLLIKELQALEVEGRNFITDSISRLIEDFRDVVINGNDNLPPLDPLDIPVIGPFSYRAAPATTAQVTIHNFQKTGLRWYVLDDISFNTLRLTFAAHLTVPWITATGSYDARARLGLLTHNAGGNFRIFAHRIEVGVNMRLGTNLFGGHLVLRELNIRIDIHDTQISITGMTGSSIINAFINRTIQNVTQDVIQNQLENVSQILSEELFDVINEVLRDYTINDILG